MSNNYHRICDILLFLIAAVRRLFQLKHILIKGSKNSKAIIIGNGPSIQKDIPKILEKHDECDVYCVNYMALDALFFKIKPRYYVLADPVFWREDVNANFKEDNKILIKKLNSANWKMEIICPLDGLAIIEKLLKENKFINITAVPNYSVEFKSTKLTLLAYRLKIGAPIFVNVLILAIWHALVTNKKIIDVYGADFSSFKEFCVDQKTNELYSNYTHFYKNTLAQSNANEKYIGVKKKKIHTRLYQSWLSFQQMYFLSLYAKRQQIKITNLSSNSYLDCFDRY